MMKPLFNLVELLKSVFTAPSRQSGSTTEIVKPLKLDLQFFADPDPDKDKEEEIDKDKDKEPDKKQDPDIDPADKKQEDEEPSLTELFKKNPKLKEQYSEKFQKDFNKRLKGMNLEEARKAVELLEKLGLTPDGKENPNPVNQQQAAAPAPKLEAKMKDLSFKVYLADKGLDTALIGELGKSKVSELELNDDGELDAEDLDEIIEGLEKRFPTAFAEKKDAADPKDTSYTPGGRQKTNPPPKKSDIEAATQARFDRLYKKKKKD